MTYGIRKLRSDYYSKKTKESSGDIRSTWKILKEITNNANKSTSINEINIDGKVVSDGKSISDVLNDHFVSIGNKLAGEILDPVKTSIDYLSKTGKIDTRSSFKRIQPKQVFDILSKLKKGKAMGQNMIPNQILKSSKNIISQSLADIFNASLKSSIFPDDLKIARVAPIFKEGDRDDMTNYRPISVLCTVACVFERLLYNQLHGYLIDNKILHNNQWGFRSLHSTSLVLIDCADNWAINIDNGNINFTLLLDIKKAFDTIDHNILMQKLNHCGVANSELEFFRFYLNNRAQCCNVNGHNSTFRIIKHGVPQGCILGPLLFIIYTNDLPLCVEHGHVTMYADDTSSSTCIKSVNDIVSKVVPDMQNIIDRLKANRLSLHAAKTEFMLSGTAAKVLKFGGLLAIRIDSYTIKRVHMAKYLGIIIDDKMSWKDHTDYISIKIKQNIDMMKRVRRDVPTEYLISFYRTLVEPYIRYCNTTWGRCNTSLLDNLQTLQNRAARVIANVKYENTDHAKLLKDLDWLNVRELIEFDTTSLVYKVENDLAPTHMKEMFVQTSDLHTYSTRSATSGGFHPPHRKLNIGKASFSYRGAHFWNQLPHPV